METSFVRLLAFDVGRKRIGVAFGQTVTKTTKPLGTIHVKDHLPDWSMIKEWIKIWQPQAFLVGLPLNLEGQTQFTTDMANEFANELKQRFNLPVLMVDERLTTVEARARIFEHGGYKALVSTEIDAAAAQLILEDWMRNHAIV